MPAAIVEAGQKDRYRMAVVSGSYWQKANSRARGHVDPLIPFSRGPFHSRALLPGTVSTTIGSFEFESLARGLVEQN